MLEVNQERKNSTLRIFFGDKSLNSFFFAGNIFETVVEQTKIFVENIPGCSQLKKVVTTQFDEMFFFLSSALSNKIVGVTIGERMPWYKIFYRIISRDLPFSVIKMLLLANNANPDKNDSLLKIRNIYQKFYPFYGSKRQFLLETQQQ